MQHCGSVNFDGLKVHAMSEPLITPRKSRWESVRDWCKSWSPQVKQGVIGGAILVVLTVAGWLLHSTNGSSNVTKNANIAATNVSGPVVLVQGNGNTLTVPQIASE